MRETRLSSLTTPQMQQLRESYILNSGFDGGKLEEFSLITSRTDLFTALDNINKTNGRSREPSFKKNLDASMSIYSEDDLRQALTKSLVIDNEDSIVKDSSISIMRSSRMHLVH